MSDHNRSKKIRAVGLASALMSEHYRSLDEASRTGSHKIAWCGSVGPAELLRAMGFLPYFPENHAAMLGVQRMAGGCMNEAHALGYAPDICSYLRSDIGAFRSGQTALSRMAPPIATVPRPDVLVYSTNQCRDIKDWFMWYGRSLGVPCIGVEGHRNVDDVTEAHVDSYSLQLRALLPQLAAISGRRLDPGRLKETVALSGQCSLLWESALKKAIHKPSPASFVNYLTLLGPVIVARGTETVIDYLEALVEELDTRIANDIAAVSNERFRLYWDGMPIWGRLAQLTRLFMELRVSVVASTFCNSWVFGALDPSDAFDSMARAYTELFIARSDVVKERYLEEMVATYHIDGMIFHDAKTCSANSNSRYGMPTRLRDALHIPILTIYGDHNDLSLYNEDRTATQFEAFVEQLERN